MKKESEWLRKIIESQMDSIKSLDLKDELLGDYYAILKDIQNKIVKERLHEKNSRLRLCKVCNTKTYKKDWKYYYDPRSGYQLMICPNCMEALMDSEYEDILKE